MDTLAHGLYGAAIFRKKKSLFWWALLFGMLPDIIFIAYHEIIESRLYPLLFHSLHINLAMGSPNTLYYITHSFVTVGLVFILLYFIRRELTILTFPLTLHILFDIPFHCGEFGTRFLYPFSNISFCGYDYADFNHAWLWPINYTIIGILYYFLQRREKRKKKSFLQLDK